MTPIVFFDPLNATTIPRKSRLKRIAASNSQNGSLGRTNIALGPLSAGQRAHGTRAQRLEERVRIVLEAEGIEGTRQTSKN